jgi:hypothetical protein
MLGDRRRVETILVTLPAASVAMALIWSSDAPAILGLAGWERSSLSDGGGGNRHGAP